MRNTKRQYKHTMKTRYRKQRKTKKGGDGIITASKGIFNFNKSNPEPNKLNIYSKMDWESLNKEYNKSCPTRMGFKNTSNNCKEIEFELQKEKTQMEGKKKMYNLTPATSEDRHLLQHVNLPTPGKTKYDCKTIDPVQVSKLETLTDIDNVCCPSSRSLFGENNDKLCKKVKGLISVKKEYNFESNEDDDEGEGVYQSNDPLHGYREQEEAEEDVDEDDTDVAHDYRTVKALETPLDPIKKITLINGIMDTSITKINNTLKTLETDIGFGTPNYKNAGALRSNNFLTNQRQLYELESIIKSECNALRQKEEYNLVKSIWNSTSFEKRNEEIARVLIIFSGYYFGKNKINYTMTSNKAYSEAYLDNVFTKNTPGSTLIYADIISEYSDSNVANDDNLLSNQPRFTDNKNPKYIWTPTTKTEVTVDSKNVKKLICKPTDMYPPDGTFSPIAKIMKVKAKTLNLETEAKQFYTQILAARSKCKATMNKLYSTTLSSLGSTSWDKLGGRKTRRHLKQANRQTKRRSKK
jgi:hypothetical protein